MAAHWTFPTRSGLCQSRVRLRVFEDSSISHHQGLARPPSSRKSWREGEPRTTVCWLACHIVTYLEYIYIYLYLFIYLLIYVFTYLFIYLCLFIYLFLFIVWLIDWFIYYNYMHGLLCPHIRSLDISNGSKFWIGYYINLIDIDLWHFCIHSRNFEPLPI